MAQESPSRMLYTQAIQLIKKMQQAYSTSKNQTPQEISETINETLNKFNLHAGKALTNYDPVVISEIPLSSKMNTFWASVQDDVNLLQDQIDLLNASVVFSHNFVKTEVLKAMGQNTKLQNKIKTLEMYSSVDNKSLIYFGDGFITEDFIDWDLVHPDNRASLVGSGNVCLKINSTSSSLTATSTITILNGSNGLMGNNQEILDPQTALYNPITGQKLYQFKAETDRHAKLDHILDQKPNTWFEFEKYFISKVARGLAGNFNFDYVLNNDDMDKYLRDSNGTSGTLINWADGLVDNILRLSFELDLGAAQQVNNISLIPFGLSDNINNPIKITQILTSVDKTNWDLVSPENVWISNSINRQISNLNTERVLIGSAVFLTEGSMVRYVRFNIEQPKPIDCNIGHTYYVVNDPNVNTGNIPNYIVDYPVYNLPSETYDASIPYDSPIAYSGTEEAPSPDPVGSNSGGSILGSGAGVGNTVSASYVNDLSFRRLGPNPSVSNPQGYLDWGDLVQKREYFKGKRWAIGIRDIQVGKNIYNTKGIIVSRKFNIPGIIDRVSIEADISIPNGYDSSEPWIKFYISPDDGKSWYQISRIQDDFLNIPEIIAFNDPTPSDLRDPGVGYYDIKGTVNSLRVKIEIDRPSDQQTATPIVHSYKLKIIKRD